MEVGGCSMVRLTTREEYSHGAEGVSEEKLTGKWCGGKFEATAIVEKLARYENLEEDGKLYVCDDIIHPSMISRLFGVDIKAAVEILEDLSRKGFLYSELQIYCPYCEQLIGPSFKTINSLPDSYCCEKCGKIIYNILENTIVLYRKKKQFSS